MLFYTEIPNLFKLLWHPIQQDSIQSEPTPRSVCIISASIFRAFNLIHRMGSHSHGIGNRCKRVFIKIKLDGIQAKLNSIMQYALVETNEH